MELDRPHFRTASASSTTTSSELFICFTSRLSSSSSMKISKSILSPGRSARDPPVSLSTSLSRRLRTNGSIKGGQASPMFPAGGKKRGCAFENPEPSSPKVTCIGQVRVKTKKKVKQTRSLSRRRSGEVSFRKTEQAHDGLMNDGGEDVFARTQRYAPANSSSHFQQPECLPHRNQRWVHLPVTICEALRAFGAEFSCLFPCRSSSCFSTNNEREKEEKLNNGAAGEEENGQSSCGAVFARWFVALQDCEGRQGRKIELVVGGDDERTEVRERISMRSSRRHVFEDLEIKEETIEMMKGEGEGEGQDEEKARVSICIPPKNALLLMRCRSDPMKMAALANRFWDSTTPPKDEDEDKEEDHEENKDVKEEVPIVQDFEVANETPLPVAEAEVDEESEQSVSNEVNVEVENREKEENLATEGLQNEGLIEETQHLSDFPDAQEIEVMKSGPLEDEEVKTNFHEFEAHEAKNRECNPTPEKEEEEEEESRQSSYSCSSEKSNGQSSESEIEIENPEPSALEAALEGENEEKAEKSNAEEENQDSQLPNDEEDQTTTHLESEPESPETADKEEDENDTAETEDEESKKLQAHEENEEESIMENKNDKESTAALSSSSSNVLPDCLLLMMCEPKVSMEVSKETWVCSKDFIRWLPERQVRKNNGSDESKKRVSAESNPAGQALQENKSQKQKKHQQQQQQQLMQPPRSSCSLPAAAAAAASMATMIEQKLVNAAGYEPFVLTRCKSEPMRTAAAKLVPDACFWNNRKLEPHRPATFGVGAAGVGF